MNDSILHLKDEYDEDDVSAVLCATPIITSCGAS